MFSRDRLFFLLTFLLTDWSRTFVSGSLRDDMINLEKGLDVFCRTDRYFPPIFGGSEFSNVTSQPEFNADTVELARMHGYDVEVHEVTTEDGYILTHFRMAGKKSVLSSRKSTPILLVHGFIENSDHWLLLGKHSLGFMLADEGYDVWMANVRGTTYSKRHESLAPDDAEFWQFSWHEMGVHDLPATIDYILKETQQEKLLYLGYSTGTTTFFVLLSEKPQYNDKIAAMVALAPIVYWNHVNVMTRNIVLQVAPVAYDIAAAIQSIPILSFDGFLLQCVKRVCRTPLLAEQFCVPIISGLFGYNINAEDKYMLPVFSNHLSSASLKQVSHFGQNGNTKSFKQYKYSSPTDNMKKYGSVNPPDYKLENVKIPVILFTAKKDPLGSEMNVKDLMKVLRTKVIHEEIQDEDFDHNSFTWGHNAPVVLYPRVISLLNKFR